VHLHIGFYLASWGMFRGSSKLLTSGIKIFEDLSDLLLDKKGDGVIVQYESIKKFLDNKEISSTQTLITKIMLGVYSNIPAIDKFFNKTAKKYCIGINSYDDEKKVIEKINKIFQTKIENDITIENFIQKLPNENNLTKEKILDAIFFEIGKKI